MIPFVQRVAYIQSLKEETIDVPSQSCITKDNIAVDIDGILYLQCQNAELASYGIDDYRYATSQLAQTTLRSEIGKIELDKTFEERDMINSSVVQAVDMASNAWGVKVLRYEIKDINPPSTVRDALEKQMRAERERRAVVAELARLQSLCGSREPYAKGPAQGCFVCTDRLVIGATSDVTRAVGGAPSLGPVERRFGERQAADQHAMVQQRKHHRE